MKPVRREVELKYRLKGAEDFRKLCRRLGKPQADFEQVNHYFQSADGKIPGVKGVIRIRLEKGRALFSVKLGGSLDEGLLSALEYEEPWKGPLDVMPPPASEFWDHGYEGMQAIEQEVGGRFQLVWAGKMVNRRKVYPFEEDLFLEIDASLYPDGTEDFEVELETEQPEKDRNRLVNLLDRLLIRYEPQTATKYQRFLQHAGY